MVHNILGMVVGVVMFMPGMPGTIEYLQGQ